MHRYFSSKDPDPARWLALTESERVELVMDAHRKERLEPAALRMHANLQSIVETQVAARDPEAVALALKRLCSEGLSRHDAIHAIVSVLVESLYVACDPDKSDAGAPLAEAYEAAVSKLTGQRWRDSLRGES